MMVEDQLIVSIPKGWCLVPHHEIADINPKLNIDPIDEEEFVSFLPMSAVEAETGKIDLAEKRKYRDVRKGYTPFIDGDLIFAKITPCMENGKIAVVHSLCNGIGFGSTEFHVSRINKLIHTQYIYYFISEKNLRIKAKKHMTGSAGQLRVSKSYFESILIPLPPLSEQDRIVAKIEELFSELDQGIKSLRIAQQQLKIYRQAVLKWAFEGKLTAEWRERQRKAGKLENAEILLEKIQQERENRYQQQLEEWKESVRAWEANGKVEKKPGKPSKLIEILGVKEQERKELVALPEQWVWIRLGTLIESINAGKSFRCEERPPLADEFGVAKVSAVTWGEYDEKESKTCLDELKINKDYLIADGDFLFSRANTIELVGACVIAKNVKLNVMLSDKTLRFNFCPLCDKKYILYYLRSRIGRSEIEKLSTGNQESMRNIGQERIRNIIVPLTAFSEQNQIVQEIESRFSICDQLEATIKDNLAKSEALRQSILKRAFGGKLVPQDPNDEPAEKLLERIRQEKFQFKQQTKQLELELQ